MYNKLFTKILDSSIWLESTTTRLVWLTFIAVMDENGFCPFAAVGNVANRARVTLQEAQDALKCLEGPDSESGNPDNEGRRIERVPGGWMVLNAQVHREMVTRAVIQEQTRERVRKHRQSKRSCNASVTPSDTESYTDTEQASKTEGQDPNTRAKNARLTDDFERFWSIYPKHKNKGAAMKAWNNATPNLGAVVDALRWQVTQPQWVRESGRFVPLPESWIRGRRWEDEQ